MSNFTSEFLEYFFPKLSNYPDWVQITLGVIVLCFVFRGIFTIIHACGGKRL